MKNRKTKPIALAALMLGLFGGCDNAVQTVEPVTGQTYCVKAKFTISPFMRTKGILEIEEGTDGVGKLLDFKTYFRDETRTNISRAIIIREADNSFDINVYKGKSVFFKIRIIDPILVASFTQETLHAPQTAQYADIIEISQIPCSN